MTIMSPIDAIGRTSQVWLTGAFGFNPESWGYYSFTSKGRRDTIVARTSPGFLVVVYGSSNQIVVPGERRKILGILQCSHRTGEAEDFLSEEGLARWKEIRPKTDSWRFAIEVVRAWRTAETNRIPVIEFADETYRREKGASISSASAMLTGAEARKILRLHVSEVNVYGQPAKAASRIAPASEIMAGG